MGDAPEIIHATVNGMSTSIPSGRRQLIGGWGETDDKPHAVRYVRADLYDALRAQVEALQSRLEMNHAYDLNGNRIEVEPGSIPDGISCRDATIAVQDEAIRDLDYRAKEMWEALTDIAKSDDIENCLDPQRNKRIAGATIAALTKATGGDDGQQ